VLQLLENADTEPVVVQQGTQSGEPQSPMDSLLVEYQDVFVELKGLPPNRTHDHAIPLVEDARPVSVRPYRYPFFQKGEIEKIVKELWILELLGIVLVISLHLSSSSKKLMAHEGCAWTIGL
jgi:hypothetical protein